MPAAKAKRRTGTRKVPRILAPAARVGVRTRVPAYPKSADRLLKLLGASPARTAKVGFRDVRKGILSVAKRAGLTENESRIIQTKLDGVSPNEIARQFGKNNTTWVTKQENSAATKIRSKLMDEMPDRKKSNVFTSLIQGRV